MQQKRFTTIALIGLIIGVFCFPTDVVQSADGVRVHAGVDFRSRWIWRGIELGGSPQFQPWVTLSAGAFSMGVWGSHSTSLATRSTQPGASYRETNFWFQYTFDVGPGNLSLYTQNHYNPNNPFFDFDSETGSHFLQAQVMFAGKEELPIDLLFGYMYYRDPDNSIYIEGGYRFNIGDTPMRLFAGMTVGDTRGFYGYEKTALTNVGVSASRTLRITDTFSLNMGIYFILNVEDEESFTVFRLSI